MIAPVVIVALISIYYIAIGVIFAYMNGVPMLAKIIALVVPALLSGVAITVLIQRIKERKAKMMILVNTDYISGKKLEMLGLVKGSTIQTKNVGKDIMQSFKNLVGGELTAYNEMMNDARALATKRMVVEAEQMGADAVVNIRYASSAIAAGAAEVIAYGTAVKFMGDE